MKRLVVIFLIFFCLPGCRGFLPMLEEPPKASSSESTSSPAPPADAPSSDPIPCYPGSAYEDAVISWVTYNINDVIKSWGKPSKIFLNEDGELVYSWHRDEKVYWDKNALGRPIPRWNEEKKIWEQWEPEFYYGSCVTRYLVQINNGIIYDVIMPWDLHGCNEITIPPASPTARCPR